ncbi:hypothetical protein Tco_0397114 [Tanacetum coccineum]
MAGVPWYIMEHRLNVSEGCPPVRQKKRSQAPERNKAIQEEVKGLVEAGIMKENVGATYQRLVDKAFQKQIGKNLEVYVDDLILADFIIERPKDDSPAAPIEVEEELQDS